MDGASKPSFRISRLLLSPGSRSDLKQENRAAANENLGKKKETQKYPGRKPTPEWIVAIVHQIEKGEAAEVICRNVKIGEGTLDRWM